MKAGSGHLLNLTHSIGADTLAYPGDPKVSLRQRKSIDEHGSNVLEISLGTHTGTHLDAPRHMLKTGKSVTDIGTGFCMGIARCFKMDKILRASDISVLFKKVGTGEAVFIDTGHGRLWNTEDFFTSWPCVSNKVVKLLIGKNIAVMGIDTPSVDAKGDRTKNNHKSLLGSGVLIYENLANLDSLGNGEAFVYFSGPMIIENADGAPASVFAATGNADLIRCVSAFKKGIEHG
jgi:arylformamidase